MASSESVVVTGWSVTRLVSVVTGSTSGGGCCGVNVTGMPIRSPEKRVVRRESYIA